MTGPAPSPSRAWGGPLTRFERVCLFFIAGGLLARLLLFQYEQLNWDAAWYLSMAKSLVEHGEFLVLWDDPVHPTQHFPPAYPAILALGYVLGGPSYAAAVVVAVLVTLFLVGVTLFTTWDLYGRARGFAAAAIVANFPVLWSFDVEILSESLVVGFFALTIWGILKSLDRPRYIVAAGLFAGLGYLTKSSMGPFFLLAGAGGFAWRFYYVRFGVFKDKWYMLAALLFASFVVPWAGRNLYHFGWPNWQTQPYATNAVRFFFDQADWPFILAKTIAWSALVVLALGLAFLPEIKRSFRDIRKERTSALWLAVVTPSIVGIIFAASFASFENRAIVSETAIRYVITPLVPLLWLGIRELDLTDATPATPPASGRDLVRGRRIFLALGLALLVFVLAMNPVKPYVSKVRLGILYTLGSLGIAAILVARAYAWRAESRPDKGKATWRAVPLASTGPPLLLVLVALALAIGTTHFVAIGFFSVLIVGVASLAASTPQARVLAFCVCGLVVPLSTYEGNMFTMDAAADLNAEAPPGAPVAIALQREHWLYPFLRPDLEVVHDDEPHAYLVDWFPGRVDGPPPGYEVVRLYPREFVVGPGTAASLAFYGALLGDQRDPDPFVQGALYRKLPEGTAAPTPP